MKFATASLMTILTLTAASAAPLTISIATPQPPPASGFQMGDPRRPDGATLTVDRDSLRLDGQPWVPVMGEFHYARYPESEWREELLKMKAGGVDVVSTYVFWIHHEEIEGQWDWSGRRNLRHFVELCQEAGLKVVVRCGPWDHGEVRNGGFPDWLLQKGWHLRSRDTNYLASVKTFYGEIARQLSGLLWKDGGPIIGIQLENEFRGPAEYLLALKGLAREAGLDVPLYTRTGWPALTTPMPFGEIVPLYGVYAEGFWDRELTPMPDGYWRGFYFSELRTDAAIGTDILGQHEAKDAPGVEQYPYLTCEIGGGMMNSYHRRILIYPLDVESTTLVKLGSGGVSLGYYMYHGGENPDGKLTTLEESQATGMWNDMPVKNYDFQAPLGEYGQIRPQYHLLRRLHLFLHEWGPRLAGMPATMPDERPRGKNDPATLRWCVRSDGDSGFVFVNNYQRLEEMPARPDAQFSIRLPASALTFPEKPVTIPPGACFFWPFHFDLGRGVRLAWATAQPLMAVDDGNVRTIFFAETEGVPGQFAFDDDAGLKVISGKAKRIGGQTVIGKIEPGTGPALKITKAEGTVQIVLLDERASLALWKGNWQGRDRVFLTRAGLVLDGDELRLSSPRRFQLNVGIYPAPASVTADGAPLTRVADGIFQRFQPPLPPALAIKVGLEKIHAAGPPRAIPPGKIRQPVASAPDDADFSQAAVWRVNVPADTGLTADPLLRFEYVGDVARVTLNGKLLTDDFYNGMAFDVGLRRYAPGILNGDLRIEILPLRPDAPIYLATQAQPHFGRAKSMAALESVRLVPRYTVQLAGASQ